jgi:hypothetical protein
MNHVLLTSYFHQTVRSFSFSSLSFISSPPFRLVTSSHIRFASLIHRVPTPRSAEWKLLRECYIQERSGGGDILHQEPLAHYRLLWQSRILVVHLCLAFSTEAYREMSSTQYVPTQEITRVRFIATSLNTEVEVPTALKTVTRQRFSKKQ